MSGSTGSKPCINPYQSSSVAGPRRDGDSSSLESVLARLAVTTFQPGTSAGRQQWNHLREAIERHSAQWKHTNAQALLKWVTQQVHHQKNQDDHHIARCLGLLAFVLREQWDMHLIYVVSCPSSESGRHHPFGFLARLSRDSSRPVVQSASCVCLAALWRALSSLDAMVMPPNATSKAQGGMAWWISCLESNKDCPDETDGDWSELVQWCIKQWLQNEATIPHIADEGEEDGTVGKGKTKQAACVLLHQLLQNESTSSWLHQTPESMWCSFAERLIEQSQRLLDPNMPMTSFARLSLECLHLLAKIDRLAVKEMPRSYEVLTCGNGNGGLVMTMMKSTMQESLEDCPRWAEAATTIIIPILHEWSKAGRLTSYWEMDTRRESLRMFAKSVAEKILGGHLIKPTMLASFLWLLRETPSLCRNVFQTIVPRDRWGDFIGCSTALVEWEDDRAGFVPVCVLREILHLAPFQTIDLVNPSFIQNFLDKTMSFVERKETKSLALVYLDCVATLFSRNSAESLQAFQNFTQNLHSAFFPDASLAGKNRIQCDSDSSMDSLESTPTANNLSRLDVSCIDVDEVDQSATEFLLYGLEPCIRISVATLLAILWTTPKGSSDVKIPSCRHLSEFIASRDMVVPVDSTNRVSSGGVCRRSTLLRFLATAEDASLYNDSFTIIAYHQLQEVSHLRKDSAQKQARIRWLEEREKHLTQEANTREGRLNAQSTLALREQDIMYRKLTIESKETLETEILKRTEVQEECESLRQTNSHINNSLRNMEAETSRLRQKSLIDEAELKETTKLNKTLEVEVIELRVKLDEKEQCLTKLSKQVESAAASIANYKNRENQLSEHIVQNEKTIEEVTTSREEMHTTLESLFGDMVSLARAYELKEKEVSSRKESKEALIEKLEKEVENERQRRKDLEDKFRQAEYENEALSRKYARTREKLEEERRSQSRSQTSRASSVRQRDGSKSYIQQLQLSSTSRSSSSRYGKENEARSTKGGKLR